MRTAFSVLSAITLAVAGCSQKPPVAGLSFDELADVVAGCEKSGAIATDSYCKQAAAVYGPQLAQRKEATRLKKVQERAASMSGAASVPSF